MTLFDYANRYPRAPGFQKNSDTSREAARRLTSRETIEAEVMGLVQQSGAHGITVDEARQVIEGSLGKAFERTSIAARFTELEAQGRIRKAGQRNNGKGRNVNYYKTV